MDLELRPVRDDEHDAWDDAVATGFNSTEIDVRLADAGIELDRTLAALDHGEIVATAAALTFAITVPGGTVT